MPAANDGADWSLREQRLRRSISLLEESIYLIDEIGGYADLGARLAGVIDALKEDADASGAAPPQFGTEKSSYSTDS